MSGERNSSDNGPRPFVLRRRKRIPAQTTQGLLYGRHIVTSDLPTFSQYLDNDDTTSPDFKQLGKLAVQSLVCADESGDSSPVFTEERFALLTDTDIASLAKAVGEANELESDSDLDTLDSLGQSLWQRLTLLSKQVRESSEAIRQSVETAFGNLSATVQANLSDRFSALSSVRTALGSTAAVEAAKQSQARYHTVAGSVISGTPRVGDAISSFPQSALPNLDVLRPPRFEDTAAGKTAARAASASEESAKQLTEVAGLMGTMAEQMAALQTVFLSEVLPQWFQNLEDGAEATRTTLRQAESSLFWAKWALIASVVVSILMTGWQVWLAREYKLENDKQQENTELLMRQQLEAARELNSQLMKLRQDVVKPKQTDPVDEKGSTRATPEQNKSARVVK